MSTHKPYTSNEHWKAFWRVFYKRRRQKKMLEIEITEKMRTDAMIFSKGIIAEKMKEKIHQQDSRNEWKRWMTGILGEMALESFLGTKFRDTTIGESKNYDVPDLAPLGFKVGVKSFRVGNFPLVNRSRKTMERERKELDGEVFIGISQDLQKAYLFGVAFDKELSHNENNPNNNLFVKDSNALKRKTAFTEMHSLHTFNSLEKLNQLASEHNSLLEPCKARNVS